MTLTIKNQPPRVLWCDKDAVVIKDRIQRLAHTFKKYGEVIAKQSIPHVREHKYTKLKYSYNFDGVEVIMIVCLASVRIDEAGRGWLDISSITFNFVDENDYYRFIFPLEWLTNFDEPLIGVQEYPENKLYDHLIDFIEDYL